MRFSDLEFFVREALIGLRRSSLMMIISIATIIISMIIFGSFLLFSINVNNLANFYVSKLEIRVFFNDTITRREKRNFQDKLQHYKSIKSIQFIDKETAWETLKNQYAGSKLSDYIQKSPLPDTLIIKLTTQSDITTIVDSIKKESTIVEDVVYGGVIAQQIQKFSKWSKIGGITLVSLLLLATLLIIVNTIRLTIIARENEITIMQLVGATKSFIQWPFLIEGLILGTIGTSTAVLILKPIYETTAHAFQANFPFIPLVFESKPLLIIYSFIGIAGPLLGILGAYISMSRTLKFNH